MTAPTPVCPECGGSFLPGHPAGDLTVLHRHPCSVGDAQDATQAADYDRLADPLGPQYIDRPATDAELVLAQGAGLKPPDYVRVHRLTPSIRRRQPVTA